jgi:hypothetical protein
MRFMSADCGPSSRHASKLPLSASNTKTTSSKMRAPLSPCCRYWATKSISSAAGSPSPLPSSASFSACRGRISAPSRIAYNELSGQWWYNAENTDKRYRDYRAERADSPAAAKPQIVRELLHGKKGRSLLIGDGVSDLLASSAVTLFTGYGGVVARERVRRRSAGVPGEPVSGAAAGAGGGPRPAGAS